MENVCLLPKANSNILSSQIKENTLNTLLNTAKVSNDPLPGARQNLFNVDLVISTLWYLIIISWVCQKQFHPYKNIAQELENQF